MRYTLLDERLMAEIAGSSEAGRYLILANHPEATGAWLVQSLDPTFYLDFADLIGSVRSVRPSSLEDFMCRADGSGYHVVFESDPSDVLGSYEALNETPAVSLTSTLPGTINGFLPFQIQGFNFLKDLRGGVAMWSTGTGKTVLAAALIKYHIDLADFDYCWVVVKAHNKFNTARTLERLAHIDCTVLDGPQKRRQEVFADLSKAKGASVVVTNYEKFRVDSAHLIPLFEGKRVLLIWDEMPTKLKSRKSQLYKSVRKALYKKVDLSVPRPAETRQYMLSATPIENNPEDWFNCVRLIEPGLYGSIKNFRDEYVQSYNPFSHEPSVWKNLDKMGLKAAKITHQIDKTSPDIAKQFPKVIDEPYYIDWDKENRPLYEMLTNEAKNRSFLTDESVLGLIHVLQMMCCAPSMVQESAHKRYNYELDTLAGHIAPKAGSIAAKEFILLLNKNLQDKNFSKLETLKHLLLEQHPDEKVVIFSSFNDTLMPILSDHLNQWGVQHVRYDGTAQQKQIAQDYFQNEDFVRVFLSSDQGSDSISLEQASVVIHYDLPWKWSTYIQRQNRIHRVTSEFDHVRFYTLMMVDSVEERKMKIISKKQSYHDGVFKGDVSDQSESARMTREDLLYILG